MNPAITLWNKHLRKSLRHPEEVFGMLIQPILWVVLFGIGMRSLFESATLGSGQFYITFMLPGIIALSAMGGAIGGGAVWLNERILGIVKEYLVAPVPRLSILLGNALSVVTKSLFQALVIFIIGVLMGAQLGLNPLGWLGGIVLVVGYGLGFTGIALAFASKTNDPGSYHMLIMLLNLPLLFLSNAFYPLASLPTWMRIGAKINPTSYLVDGVRQTVLAGGATITGGKLLPLWVCFLVVAVFAGLGMWLAYVAFKRTVK